MLKPNRGLIKQDNQQRAATNGGKTPLHAHVAYTRNQRGLTSYEIKKASDELHESMRRMNNPS